MFEQSVHKNVLLDTSIGIYIDHMSQSFTEQLLHIFYIIAHSNKHDRDMTSLADVSCIYNELMVKKR